jgi:uncharacterized glyoxalase superfamily protein PhnB
MAVKPIPEGYHSVTPYLVVEDAAGLIEFMKRGLGAEERFKMEAPDGKIGHAEMQVGDSVVMLSSSTPEYPAMPAMIHLYVDNVDAVYKKALEAGATTVRELSDQFYGDRSGGVKDAFGNQWFVATHIEDVPPDEMEKRAAEAMAQMSGTQS